MRDVLWVAGLYEGEGYLVQHARNGHWAIGVHMTDLDVIERLRDAVGFGSIHTYLGSVPHHKPIHKWRLSQRQQVAEVVRTLRPHMGARRGARMDQFLAWNAARPIRRRHHVTPEQLREANARRNREYRARKRARESPG